MIKRTACMAFCAAALAVAPSAWAADDDAPVATADGGPGAYSLDDQIAAWRAAGDSAPAEPGVLLMPGPDRRPHGVLSVGVGTGGYRSVYAQTDLPVGKTGTLSMAIGDQRGRFWGRDVHSRSLSLGLSFDATNPPACAGLGPKAAPPWRRLDPVEQQRLQAACDAAQPE